jgi:hypothetical protein
MEAAMKIREALQALTEELVESHARCPHPYVLTSGPCAIKKNGEPRAGVYAMVHSDAFGRIGTASAMTLEDALIQLCQELNGTREMRWVKEAR